MSIRTCRGVARAGPDTVRCRQVPISSDAEATAASLPDLAFGRLPTAAAIPCAAPLLEIQSSTAHPCCMGTKDRKMRHGFWPLALLWLPAGVVVQAVARFPPESNSDPGAGMWMMAAIMSASSLIVLAPCGLPLALGCRKLWRLGYRRVAWWLGISLGALTVAASVFAGLLGPVAIAVCALLVSMPVWMAWWWLARHA